MSAYPPNCPFREMFCYRHGIYPADKSIGDPVCPGCAAEDARLEALVERVVRRVLATEHKGQRDA